MNNELMNRARELLALRDKATPIQGAVFNRYAHGGGRLYTENGTRTLIADCFNEGDREFFFAAHDMADTIRALLAEVERLAEVLKVQLEANVAVSDHAVAETRRAIRAESRLRELASAEPVAYGFANTAITGSGPTMMMLRHEVPPSDQYAGQFWIPLIRRPEMPK